MKSELARRILFAVVAAPLTIACLVFGGAPLAALLAIAAALGASEFFRIARAGGLAPMDNLGIVIAGVIPLAVHARYLGFYEPRQDIGPVSIAMVVVLVVLGLTIWTRGVAGRPLGAAAATVFGAAYTGGALSYAYVIRYHEYAFAPANVMVGGRTMTVPSGGLLLLLPVLVTWASDIGAFVVGRTLGRHKLIPSVSPGKTVEGAIGGLVVSMLVAWAYTSGLLSPATHLGFRGAPAGALAFGAFVSIVAQVGDLAESMLKREAGVKDSSSLIPGHGGVLDRVDSLLFVLPLSYMVLGPLLVWAP